MHGPASPFEVTATGNYAGATELASANGILYGITVSGTGATSAVVKSGGSGGTTVATLRALAGDSKQYSWPEGIVVTHPVHVTLTGTGVASTASIG